MAKGTDKDKTNKPKRQSHVKKIYTVSPCLPFMNHKYKKYDLTRLKFQQRYSILTDDFKQPDLHFSKKMRLLHEDEWVKIKDSVLKKFAGDISHFRRFREKSVYDLNKSLLTKKQKQSLKFEETIIEQHFGLGYERGEFKILYGKNKLPRIKRIILKELFRRDDEPITVNCRAKIKVTRVHIDEIIRIAGEQNFLGGIPKIQSLLSEHSNPDIRIDLCRTTIKRILLRSGLFFKNVKIIKRTTDSKPGPTLSQKKHLARIIFYLLYKGYTWIVEDEVFMVCFLLVYDNT